jgi:hypothetical protein
MEPPSQDAQALALRARIVLLCAEGRSNTDCADRKTDSARRPRRTLQLENAIRHFVEHHNQNPKPFVSGPKPPTKSSIPLPLL